MPKFGELVHKCNHQLTALSCATCNARFLTCTTCHTNVTLCGLCAPLPHIGGAYSETFIRAAKRAASRTNTRLAQRHARRQHELAAKSKPPQPTKPAAYYRAWRANRTPEKRARDAAVKKAYRLAHADEQYIKRKEQQFAKSATERERDRQRRAAYTEKNRDRINEAQRQYIKAHKAQIQAMRKAYRAKNRDKINARQRNWNDKRRSLVSSTS